MTAYSKSITEPGGTSDVPSRTNSFSRGSAETLSASDSPLRTGAYVRRGAEIGTVSEGPSRLFGAHRGAINTLSTTDVIISNQTKVFSISESLSPSSVAARRLGSQRLTVETLGTSQLTSRTYNSHRLYLENHASSDSLSKRWISVRSFIESHTASDQTTRTSRNHRIMGDSIVLFTPSLTLLPSLTLWSSTSSDSVSRSGNFRRVQIYAGSHQDIATRSLGIQRAISQILSLSDVLSISQGNHPRSINEILTHSDLPSYSLIGPILGSLWYDPITKTFYEQLPDWEFMVGRPQIVLVPGFYYPSTSLLTRSGLDGLYYAPKRASLSGPNREK